MITGAIPGPDGLLRCPWALSAPEYLAYHDDEWGRPVTTVQGIYERMTLEAFQSGLSWITVLRKRENFRRAFAGFQPDLVSALRAIKTKLQADAVDVRRANGLSVLKDLAGSGQDLVFLDPPFDAGLVDKAVQAAVAALGPEGWLYLEAQHQLTEAGLEAHGLELVRHMKAGAVHAHLLRTPEPAAA